ncbi:MAG TPA: winged helix-turn-helix domain-containing protein, partial [Vicinamibacterales bacterium]|nr:winged helix-turn-helix domain-containing protein [Vicinamibacterales bacterium]
MNQCIWREGTRLSLKPKPYAVLQYLVTHAGRLVTPDELLGAIWPDTFVQAEVLRQYILEIRRILGDRAEAPAFIQTFPKRGWEFIAPVTDESTPSLGARDPSATRIVGRAAALAELDGYLSRALDSRRQVVFVVGEAGIGKTSLMDVFQRTASGVPALRVARGQSVEGFGGKEPYYPVLEALGKLARGPAGAHVVNTLQTHAPTWMVQFPALVRRDQKAALQREILGATRERMVREFCEALEVMTAASAIVLILE